MIKDFNDFKEFIVLAKYLNYQEASERLFISPSALSKHIMGLEKNLGVALFDRSTRNVRLTKYGEIFLQYAQQIIDIYEQCNEKLNELKIDSDHHVRVGFLSRLEQCGIIEVISEFPQAFPGISVDMAADVQPLELLRTGNCDFIFDTDNYPKDADICSVLFKKDSLAAVLPKNHRFAAKKSLALSELKDEKFIIHNDTFADPAGIDVPGLCGEAGFIPEVVMSAAYTSTIVKLVAQGMGIAVINKMNIPKAILPTVAIVDITPEMPFFIYLLYLKNRRKTLAGEKFLKYIISKT